MHGQETERVKPLTVQNYNDYMGRVDLSHMMLYMPGRKKNTEVLKKVTFYILSRMVVNVYFLYK
jgi:hypothetical protein